MPTDLVALTSLWLPILLSVIACFLMSFLLWAVIQWHKSDWKKLPDEATFRQAMTPLKLPPGQYVVPHCASNQEMASDEHKQKVKEGPVGFLTVLPNAMPNMGKMMGGWSLYLLLVVSIIAYLTSATLGAGEAFSTVFRISATSGLLGFCMAIIPGSIWFGRSWSSTVKEVVDGVLYAFLTALILAWLWPR